MPRVAPALLLLLTLSLLLAPAPAAAAGWVDDWLVQRTSTPATYFEGQKRGYYSAGSFSARWPSQNDYPVTVQMPKLSGGCGGIDLFGGGVSFLDFDYLVEKLQRILQSGGAVAFELALNTLCPECVNAVNNLESIANKLNSMQMDECALSKKLVATLSDGKEMRQLGSDLAGAVKSFDLDQGLSDLYTAITENHAARKGQIDAAENARIMQGCPQDIKEVFLNNFSGASSSLLHNLGANKMGVNQAYIDVVRGLVGDIQLEAPANGYVISYIPPCPENAADDSKHLLDGKTKAKGLDGACYLPASTNADLTRYFQNEMSAIAARIRTKQPLTAAQTAFLQGSPLSLGLVLKTAVGTEMEGQTIAVMADITAKAHALQMLADLYSRAKSIGDRGKALLAQRTAAVDGQEPSTCAAEVFTDTFMVNVDRMLDQIYKLQDGAKKSYTASAQETALVLEIVDHLRQSNERLRSEVSRRFSPALANQVFN